MSLNSLKPCDDDNGVNRNLRVEYFEIDNRDEIVQSGVLTI